MLWGPTTFDECVATVRARGRCRDLDLAPRYGDGKTEEIVEAAFDGKLPADVGSPACNPATRRRARSRQSSGRSKAALRLRLSRLDVFFLHSNVAGRGLWRDGAMPRAA
jgi:hypothetical protein